MFVDIREFIKFVILGVVDDIKYNIQPVTIVLMLRQKCHIHP